MAITDTNKTAALQTKTYAATIAGQTARIADAHEIIQAKAILMGLSVQRGEGDSNRGGSSAVTLADSHKIMDTASAINSINIQEYLELASSTSTDYLSSNLTLTANGSVYIPVGYNKNPFTITAASLDGQTAGTASAGTIIAGKTAFVNGAEVEGTLPLDKILDSYSTTDASGNTVTGQVQTKTKSNITGSSTGVYDPNNLTVEVRRVDTPETGAAELTNSITIPAGYYAEDITIKPVVKDADGKVETTLNYGGVAYSGDLTFASGKYTAYPKDTNKDYISSVEISQHIAGTKDSTTGAYNVTTGGWINKGDSYGGLSEGSYTTANEGTNAVTISGGKAVIKEAVHGYTPATINASLPVSDAPSASYNADAVNANTITVSGSVTLEADKYYGAKTVNFSKEVSIDGTLVSYADSKTAGKTYATHEVNADKSYINIAAGYLPETHIELDVKDAVVTKVSTPTLKDDLYYVEYKITEGWTPGETFNVPLGKSTHADASKIALNTAGTAYEASCTSTAGYTTGETVKINIGKSELTPAGVTYSGGKFTASATTTSGYTVGETKNAAAFTVTELGTTIDKTTSIVEKSYFPAAATVASVAGTLADGAGSNANIGTASSEDSANTASTKLADLTKDTTYTAANNQYYTSFKVEVEDTIAALQAI